MKSYRIIKFLFTVVLLVFLAACGQDTNNLSTPDENDPILPDTSLDGTLTPDSEEAEPAGSEAIVAAQRQLAGQLGVSIEQVDVIEAEQVEWPDTCLGLERPGEDCAQIATPGWHLWLSLNGQVYEVRTDLMGNNIRYVL